MVGCVASCATTQKSPFFSVGAESLSSTSMCDLGQRADVCWGDSDVAKLLPILNVVENHLNWLLHHPDRVSVINPVFRAMRGLSRHAARRGMEDFHTLAREVAYLFHPARRRDARVKRRMACLALVAVGQMRCLLMRNPDEEMAAV